MSFPNFCFSNVTRGESFIQHYSTFYVYKSHESIAGKGSFGGMNSFACVFSYQLSSSNQENLAGMHGCHLLPVHGTLLAAGLFQTTRTIQVASSPCPTSNFPSSPPSSSPCFQPMGLCFKWQFILFVRSATLNINFPAEHTLRPDRRNKISAIYCATPISGTDAIHHWHPHQRSPQSNNQRAAAQQRRCHLTSS